MNAEKEITVFICEDNQVAKEIATKYFNKGQITFASIFPESKREAITSKLEELEN